MKNLKKLEEEVKILELSRKKENLEKKGLIGRELGGKELLAILLVLVLFSLIGYWYYQKKQKESETEEAKQAIEETQRKSQQQDIEFEKQMNEVRLQECVSLAQENYKQRWDSTCEGLGLEKECMLPSETAKYYDEGYNNDKTECTNLYGK